MPHLTPLEKAASGALASAFANTLVYPLDLSKTIIQTQVKKRDPSAQAIAMGRSVSTSSEHLWEQSQRGNELKYKSALDVLRKIYKKKGVLGWYHGLLSSIVGTTAQNFSYFYWYTIVRRVFARLTSKNASHKHSTATELFLGALAAAISQLFTMPIGVVTTQQQTDKHRRSLYQLIKEVYVHDGIKGFWKGLNVSLVLCINPSITYGSFERLRQILYNDKQYLGPLESFSIGMLAKSLATIATQPLIVSKAMLQKKHHPAPKDGKAEAAVDEGDEIKFDSFTHALEHLWKTEKFHGLYKGIGPQLLKGVIVQGLLFMFKDQLDMLFLLALKSLQKRRRSLVKA
ncbi:putative peroxisomal adenine nucleotide transporter [Clavispora lusitaniae]|uniref:Peroxisomal adenine nucleotide transporter n=1 Tax=Clavispora lusitaniae TaxID=36911 RepID=A0AA91Q515_CLALS|nr:putative peroxisomal adenine nucleotide transporter [Clavispora lusitaniae]